jgi:hypothetical protein
MVELFRLLQSHCSMTMQGTKMGAGRGWPMKLMSTTTAAAVAFSGSQTFLLDCRAAAAA